jgi:ATP-dependent Clp protease ATP-binding subunit ClpA
MFERIAQDTRRVLRLAQHEAERLGHRHIGTEHLLLALLGERRSYGATVLLASGLRPEDAAQALANADVRDEPVVDRGLTARAGWVLARSFQEAVALGSTSVHPEHQLLALIADERALAGQVLRQYAPSLEARILPRHRFTATPHAAALRTSTYAALSEPARQVMQLAQDEAARLKHNYIGTEHLLLALL